MNRGLIGRIARKPREPSAAGFIIVSTLTGLYQAGVASPGLFLAGVAVMLVHLITFDPILDEARRWNLGWLGLLAAVNFSPYIYGLAREESALYATISLSLAIIALHLALVYKRRWNDPWVYITGSAITALPGLNIPVLLTGEIRVKVLLAWIAVTLYIVASSAYIESMLPFREFDPRISLILWVPIYILCRWSVLLCMAFIEPFYRYLVNVFRPSKIKGEPRAIRKFGWSEFRRFILYIVLLNVALGLAA